MSFLKFFVLGGLFVFSDVANHDYEEAIVYAQEMEWIQGYEDGRFGPDDVINRAEFLKLMVEQQGIDLEESCELPFDRFSDVSVEDWFEPYVCVGVQETWVQGHPDGRFAPEESILFAEAAKIFLEINQVELNMGDDLKWYAPYTDYLRQHSYQPPSVLGPEYSMTRAEVAELLFRFDRGVELASSEGYLLFSAMGLNAMGGPLDLYAPQGMTTDGDRLIVADRNNNRVLIWNEAPDSAEDEPDLVLGQEDFYSFDSGRALDEMNWPTSAATDGKRLLVADAYNHRILVWEEFPKQSGAAADFVIEGEMRWPWDVWTDGEKVVVANTGYGRVDIWNSFPDAGIEPDVKLRDDAMGTPRSIGSDGQRLVIGDHNAKVDGQDFRGTFFWDEFPESGDEPFDFVWKPSHVKQGMDLLWTPLFFEDGSMLGAGSKHLFVWDAFPEGERDVADQAILQEPFGNMGIHSLAVVGSRLYVSLAQGNRIFVYEDYEGVLNGKEEFLPDFALGSSDIWTDPLDTEFFFHNPVPVTDGESLAVFSDIDRSVRIWDELPEYSGQMPDREIPMDWRLGAHAWHEGQLVMAGKDALLLWEEGLPKYGEEPSKIYEQDYYGVAWDDSYFYLSHSGGVEVWADFPEEGMSPLMSLEVPIAKHMASDGEYLAVTSGSNGGILYLFAVSDLSEPLYILGGSNPLLWTNLSGGVALHEGQLLLSDGSFSRVLVWDAVEHLLNDQLPDRVVGADGIEDRIPGIGPGLSGEQQLFWSDAIAFDGQHLWVGEFKFSNRLHMFLLNQ